MATVVGGAVVGQTNLSNAAINGTGVDGHVLGTIAAGSSGTLAALTTTVVGDYIIVNVVASQDVASVSDTAVLQWFLRTHVHVANAFGAGLTMHQEEWVAYSSGTLVGDVITVSLSASGNAAMVAVAVKGTYHLAPFDPYAISTNLSASTTTPATALSTADPTGIVLGLFGWAGGSAATFTAGAGFTDGAGWSVTQSTNVGAGIEYQVVNAVETALSVTATLGVAEPSSIIADALMADGDNVYAVFMPTNQEGTIHNIYYDNTAGLLGTPAMVIARVDSDGGSETVFAPVYNGSLETLHIHITEKTAGILFVNQSLVDQYRVAWGGLRTI